MQITQFTMEEVRCFAESQKLEIRPLTFLVGENSTGKSTALACFHVLADYFRHEGVDFNSYPYSMGTFKEIVRNSKKKAKVFKLGFAFKREGDVYETTVEFVQKEKGIEPTVATVTQEFSDGKIVYRSNPEISGDFNVIQADKEQNEFVIDCDPFFLDRHRIGLNFHFLTRERMDDSEELTDENEIALAKYMKSRKRDDLFDLGWEYSYSPSVFSTSAIRSRPKRTYDPTREFKDPEGSDVPMLLMRTEATQKAEWEKLTMQLAEFGRRSGLFKDIQIKNLGRSLGAPFQLKFKVRGPTANIVDVGYGVSQILPVLVHILHSEFPTSTQLGHKSTPFFLLQQPEVHLHPRAQTELSSLLAKLASKQKRSFIVETHSDYMVDRARIEIRKGNIDYRDVSLIYFEPRANIVRVHNIGFDNLGNMDIVPLHYRRFFLDESDRLMGFED